MGAPAYAKLVPRLRAIKGSLLTRDRVRDILSAASLDEVLAALRETIFHRVSEAKSPEEAEAAAWRTYFEVVRSVYSLAPARARPLVEFFWVDEESRDILNILSAVYSGQAERVEAPTAAVPDTITGRVLADRESLASVSRLLEAVKGTWAERLVGGALRVAQETRAPESITWYHLPFTLNVAANAIKALPRGERAGVERVLCALIEYKLSSSMIQAKLYGFPTRFMDSLLAELRVCGLSWSDLRHVYEREPDAMALASSIRDSFRLIRIDGRSVEEVLSGIRRSFRLEAYRRSMLAFAEYPFKASLAAATLMLVRLQLEDVRTVITALKLRLSPSAFEGELVAGMY